MNTQTQVVAVATRQYDPVLEGIIKEANERMNDSARKKAQHLAKRNQPHPVGDKFEHYITDAKAFCEKLGAIIFHHLQPEAHFPEATWDAEYYKEKDAASAKEIQKKEFEMHNLEHQLGNFNPMTLHTKIKIALIASGIILLGETIYDTKAFQIMGDTLLFAFVFAICVSLAVLFFSHFTAFKYKKATTPLRKRIIVFLTLGTVTALFTVLGIFRSKYLDTHDVHLSPVYFVIINLFFFIVTFLISLYMLPTLEEIKANGERIKVYRAIQNLAQVIEQLKIQKEQLKKIALETKKQRARIVFNAQYSLDMARAIYFEYAGELKSEILIYRTDGKVPDCYSDPLPELEIKEIAFLNTTAKVS